jgi:RNA polymerase sigma-70 factor (ECF subfamily)
LLQGGAHAAAFSSLVVRYERKIYSLCCGLLRDRDLAEDAAQESLVRIWKALGRYDGRASLSTWIYAITRNRCLTAIERRRAGEALMDSDVPLEFEAPAAASPGVDDQPINLRDLVDSMPDRYRRALTLYYYEERSVTEAASMLGIPEGTLKTNLFRARGLLLDRIRQLGLDDPVQWLNGNE